MAQAPPQQTYYIVLPPQADPDVSVRPFSRLLGEEEDKARELLQCPSFQVVRRYAKRGNAESFQSQLHALGVDSFLASDTEIHGALFIWAQSANYGAGGMAVKDFGGQPLYCPFDDLICISIGSVGRTDGTTTRLIDFHRRSTSITPRIDEALFDFASFLPSGRGTAEELLEELQAVTTVIVDRRFDEVRGLMGPCAKALANYPSEYPPGPDHLSADYEPKDVRALNVYGALLRMHLLALQAGN